MNPSRALFVLLATVVFSPAAFAQTSDRSLITVSGEAEVMVVPDEVVFRLGVVTLDKDLLAAQRRNDDVVKRIVALASKYDIPSNHVQTGHISLEQRYTDEEESRKPPVFLGYEVSKNIAIVLRDVSKAETLLTDIFKSGVSKIDGVEFRSTQSRKHKDEARALAMKAAQEKASAMAREIGQPIGRAHTIVEETANPYSGLANTTRGIAARYDDSAATIALGQISISARVTVSFELK